MSSCKICHGITAVSHCSIIILITVKYSSLGCKLNVNVADRQWFVDRRRFSAESVSPGKSIISFNIYSRRAKLRRRERSEVVDLSRPRVMDKRKGLCYL